MNADKSCILFDGGKKIKLSTDQNPGNEGIKFSKNSSDGSWDVTVKLRISALEAKNVIFKFSELDPQGKPFDDVFPNMTFFTAMDNSEHPIEVPLMPNSEILPSFDRDLGGSLTLKMNIDNFGKTQNSKTQNVHT
jgi:hypothetical protein